jgi:hypothetical protein
MALYDELSIKSDEQLLKIMEKESGAPAGSTAGGYRHKGESSGEQF